MSRPATFTFGTHNLHDDAGVPTFFADVVVFTEAIAPTIVAKARQKAAHASARLAGYTVVVCREQPDLVIAFRRRLFRKTGRYGYQRQVGGVPKVTPNRGTMWQPLTHRATGQPFALIAEHRINAAFPPYVRGEPAFRLDAWHRHTGYSCGLMTRLVDSGYIALGAGDLNTPRDVAGYPGVRGVQELQHDLQRQAIAPRWKWRLSHPEQLGLQGSDHPRDRVTVEEARPTR